MEGNCNCNCTLTLTLTLTLADDILEEILSLLPAKDLLRLRCVSKSWRALIDGVSFIRKHYRAQYAICKTRGDVPLFSYHPKLRIPTEFYLFEGDTVSSNLTPDLHRDGTAVFDNDPDRLNRVLFWPNFTLMTNYKDYEVFLAYLGQKRF